MSWPSQLGSDGLWTVSVQETLGNHGGNLAVALLEILPEMATKSKIMKQLKCGIEKGSRRDRSSDMDSELRALKEENDAGLEEFSGDLLDYIVLKINGTKTRNELDLPDLSDAEATSDEKETAKEDSKSSEPDHKGLGKSDQSDEFQENCDDDDDYGVPFRLFEIQMIPVVFPFLPIENDGSCYEPPPSIIASTQSLAWENLMLVYLFSSNKLWKPHARPEGVRHNDAAEGLEDKVHLGVGIMCLIGPFFRSGTPTAHPNSDRMELEESTERKTHHIIPSPIQQPRGLDQPERDPNIPDLRTDEAR
ncbi:hypothetical protein L596_000469 [Steinernema carpocapsae]|uniref:Uncharacterized protein n=1 Tax=Steinernema carpocapsae TaxID=34508 RepID=A0A4U8UKK3_STECR|nr:hypothetical protein L596_000469 [Steinernema carpocapsae]